MKQNYYNSACIIGDCNVHTQTFEIKTNYKAQCKVKIKT